MAERKAYTEAFGTGKYAKQSGLLGKYDNVRRYWEDQVTGLFLRGALNDMVLRKRPRLERLRILDMGCGGGDGYDLIMDINTKDPGLYEYIIAAVTPAMLKEYMGLDINDDLLQQARDYYGHNPKLRFVKGDMTQGLPETVKGEPPFDLYFTSYGTLSHFHDDECVKLFADICRHARDGAILVGDWLGRYSYEWQDLWHEPAHEEYFMDYRISYIYPEAERNQGVEVSSFPLRLMTRDEVLRIVEKAQVEAGVNIEPLSFHDRSILVGRHLDTGDYNRHCPKLRLPINSLFEGYTRTDLESLKVDYSPRQGFAHLNTFFESFFMSCNTLVDYTIVLLSTYDPQTGKATQCPEIQPYYPEPLKQAMHSMRRVIEGVGWLEWGDVRANVIEPHLGFSLRKLELELQPGTGVGHSLVGIFRISK